MLNNISISLISIASMHIAVASTVVAIMPVCAPKLYFRDN